MNKHLRKSVLHFIVPLLLVSLLMPVDLAAHYRGAKAKVYNVNGQVIKGRLIKVDMEEGWMVVKPREALTGTRIKVENIDKVVLKKSKAAIYIGGGLLLVISVGRQSGGCIGCTTEINRFFWGAVGLGLGIITGVIATLNGKRIYLRGKSPKKLCKILKKLKRKALISD